MVFRTFPFNSCLGQFTFLTIFVNSLVYFILFFLGKRKGDDCKIRMIEMFNEFRYLSDEFN